MGYRIKDKNKQIPNGYKFLQAETGWRPTAYSSFATIVRSLINHRRGRPDLIAKHGWSVDEGAVAYEVEQFNVRVCLHHNWLDYLEGGDAMAYSPPKTRPPSPQEVAQVDAAAGVVKKIWSGIKTLNEWISSGEPAVEAAVSESRASKCVKCPKNTSGDFSSWFTKPAAGAIKTQIERLQSRQLSTSHDAALNVCEVCLCPLKLKVHTPPPYVKAHLTKELLDDLMKVPDCWIVSEISAQ